jgi:hypothetical protein
MQISFSFFFHVNSRPRWSDPIYCCELQTKRKKAIKAIINKHKQPMCKPLKLLMEVGKENLVSHCFLMKSRLKVTVDPTSLEHKI